MKRKCYIMLLTAAVAAVALTACSPLKKENTVQTAPMEEKTAGESIPEEPADEVMAEEPAGEIIPDEAADAAENDMSGVNDTESADGWSGSYAGDEESVTIALLDESTISFAFAQSGISGTAAVNGMQAVYKGDDHYVVVFNMNGEILDVSVSNEEDYDASESPLNGTYVKE